MKRLFFKILFVLALIPLMFNSCQKDAVVEFETMDSPFLKSAVVADYCRTPVVVVDLLADQVVDVGDVTIGRNETHLFVTFSTTGGWYMTNTKVWVGASVGEIPMNKGGNLIRGKLTKNDDQPNVVEVTYAFELAEGTELGDEIIIVAHADVEIVIDDIIREETAFGEGEDEISEKAWGWYIIYIVKACCPDNVIVFRDVEPWAGSGGGDYQVDVLNAMAVTKTWVTSAAIGVQPLNPAFDLVIITADQNQAFYDAIAGNEDYFYAFVDAGGSMIWECCDNGWNLGFASGIAMPEGIILEPLLSTTNTIVFHGDLLAGLTTPLTSSYSSHEGMSNVPGGAIIYCTDGNDNPTLVEFDYGLGKMLITGQTLEWGGNVGIQMRELLPRIYAHMTCQDVPELAVPEVANVMNAELNNSTSAAK